MRQLSSSCGRPSRLRPSALRRRCGQTRKSGHTTFGSRARTRRTRSGQPMGGGTSGRQTEPTGIGAGLPRSCPCLSALLSEPHRPVPHRDCVGRRGAVVTLAVHRRLRRSRSSIGLGERHLAQHLAAPDSRAADEQAHRCEAGRLSLAAAALGRPRSLRRRTRLSGGRRLAERARSRLGCARAVSACPCVVGPRDLGASGAGWSRAARHRRRPADRPVGQAREGASSGKRRCLRSSVPPQHRDDPRRRSSCLRRCCTSRSLARRWRRCWSRSPYRLSCWDLSTCSGPAGLRFTRRGSNNAKPRNTRDYSSAA